MKSELAEEIFQLIEARSHAPTPTEFEMAYQARVAIDRIRFAIKHAERFASMSKDQMRDVGLQLLDALQRLEAVDRRFQVKSRFVSGAEAGRAESSHQQPDGELRFDKTNGCVRTRPLTERRSE